jgi:hypothetical protein
MRRSEFKWNAEKFRLAPEGEFFCFFSLWAG